MQGWGRNDEIKLGRIFHKGMSMWDCPVEFDREKYQEKYWVNSVGLV